MSVRSLRTVGALVGLPLAVAVAALVVVRGFVDELPDPVATHWGTHGVDGFTARDAATWIPAGLALVLGLGMGLALWFGLRKMPSGRRGAGAMAAGLSTFLATIGVGSLWIQRGLADAHDAPDVDWIILVGLGAAAVMALAGGFLMPGPVPGSARATEGVPASAPRLRLAEGESAVWTGWARSRTLIYVVLASMVIAIGVLVLAGARDIPLIAIIAIPTLLLLTMSTFRVVVGRQGLTVRSIAGVPRFRVPLGDVAEAGVTDVRPMRDFGGWGIRGNFRGQFGVIQRAGEALEVRRGDGSRFVVTVDDAERAAELLNTLADRERTTIVG